MLPGIAVSICRASVASGGSNPPMHVGMVVAIGTFPVIPALDDNAALEELSVDFF
jgi:hypothetical protein